jgi:hypothetical protein
VDSGMVEDDQPNWFVWGKGIPRFIQGAHQLRASGESLAGEGMADVIRHICQQDPDWDPPLRQVVDEDEVADSWLILVRYTSEDVIQDHMRRFDEVRGFYRLPR